MAYNDVPLTPLYAKAKLSLFYPYNIGKHRNHLRKSDMKCNLSQKIKEGTGMNTQRTTKRLLSYILTAVMVLALLPAVTLPAKAATAAQLAAAQVYSTW